MRYKPSPLWIIIAASLLFKIAYLFLVSDYKENLYSDMLSHWERAVEHYRGNVFAVSQWTLWSPLFHLFIFQILKISAFFNLPQYALEMILLAFVLLSTVATFFVYPLTRRMVNSEKIALVATTVYAFSYPYIFFTSCLLTENLATPLLVFSSYLVLTKEGKGSLFAAGVLLAGATACRPNLGLLGVPFFLYRLFQGSNRLGSFLKAVSFAAGFGVLLFLAGVENRYLSRGVVTSFAANGGMNFFIQHCKPYKIDSFGYGSKPRNFYPPSARKKENGVFRTDHPFHDQAYFYKQGIECIRENPAVLLENLKRFQSFFWGEFFPARRKTLEFKMGMWISSWMHFLMTLSLGLFFIFLRKRQEFAFKETGFYVSLLIFNGIPLYFYSIERRYLFPCLFALYIPFFSMLPMMRRHRRTVLIYSGILFALFAAAATGRTVKTRVEKARYGVDALRTISSERASKVKPLHTPWDEWGNLIFPDEKSGWLVKLKQKEEINAARLEISTDCNDRYKIALYRDGRRQAEVELPPAPDHCPGLYTREMKFPRDPEGRFFNEILLTPAAGDNGYSVGHIRLKSS